jgi:hypothetical protein
MAGFSFRVLLCRVPGLKKGHRRLWTPIPRLGHRRPRQDVRPQATIGRHHIATRFDRQRKIAPGWLVGVA